MPLPFREEAFMRIRLLRTIAAALLALTVLAAGCGRDVEPTATQDTVTITTAEAETTTTAPILYRLSGELVLAGNRNPAYSDNCRGFSDHNQEAVKVGAQVTVKDESDKIIGTGALTDCQFVLESPEQARAIRLGLVVENLPAAEFYTVEAAGGVPETFSFAELDAAGWTVQLEAACEETASSVRRCDEPPT